MFNLLLSLEEGMILTKNKLSFRQDTRENASRQNHKMGNKHFLVGVSYNSCIFNAEILTFRRDDANVISDWGITGNLIACVKEEFSGQNHFLYTSKLSH